MNNKQNQVFFLVAFSCLLIGSGISYLIFGKEMVSEEPVFNQQKKEHDDSLPPGLLEGVLYNIDVSEREITIDIVNPQEIYGERVEILFETEKTKFVELFLNVDDPENIKDVGRQTLDYNFLSKGDEVLVDIGDVAVNAVKEGRVLSASTITLITAE